MSQEQSIIDKYSGKEFKTDNSTTELQVDNEGSMPWSEVGVEAIKHIPSSGGQLIKDTATAVMNPIDTTWGIVSIGAGVLQELLPESWVTDTMMEDKASREMARKVGQMLVERYGGMEEIKKTMATDPVGFLGDAAMILGVGGATLPSKAGKIANKAATIIEPMNIASKAVQGTGTVVGKATQAFSGVATGSGLRPLQEAYKAGREGNPDFVKNMRGGGDFQSEVISNIKQSLNNVRVKRSTDYVNNMEQVGQAVEPIKFDNIVEVGKKALDRTRYGDEVIDANAAEALNKVNANITRWQKLDPSKYHTALGVDALKKLIGSTLDTLEPNTNAYNIVNEVYNSVKSEIVSQAPIYAEAMKQYEEATVLIREAEKSLSLGNKASADTTMRKLQSLMRDDVQTNYGERVKLAEQIQANGTDIMPQLAGQTLHPFAPRGLARAASPMAIASQGLQGDWMSALAMAGLSSPRIAGEVAHALGQTARVADNVKSRIPQNVRNKMTHPALRGLLYQSRYLNEDKEQ